MSQRKFHSFIEAWSNTIIGYLLSMLLWWTIMEFYFHKPVTIYENFIVVGIFAASSFIRGYVLRRLFNRLES